MKFTVEKSIEILERTPMVLETLLFGISDDWSKPNEGENTFSPFDVVGHLIHGEKTDWIPRMNIILADDPTAVFEPFDRFAQFQYSQGKSLDQLIKEFNKLRKANIKILQSKNLTEIELVKRAQHPSLGVITLSQLLATWTAHDLAHIGQIARVMAKQYRLEVGPWEKFLPILSR
ncbi:MAG: DinB family protein [Saprospiraceae bacterium]|nr:DinB family protein [Saprospiraceae bacterium]